MTERRRTHEAARRVLRISTAIAPPIAVLIVVLGVWLVISYVVLDPRRQFLLPPPQAIVIEGFLDPASREAIMTALWSTAGVGLTGLIVAAVAGFVLAVTMSQARWLERSLYPWAVVIQTIPILALVPVIGFWWGFGFPSRVFVCVIIALFPIVTNTLFGLKSADRRLHDVFTLHGASRVDRLLKLQIPYALPAIFSGLRIAAGLAVVGAIVGDFFFRQGRPGIGRLLDLYRANLQSEQLFAAVFVASALGLSVFWFFGWLGHRITHRWHDTTWAGHD